MSPRVQKGDIVLVRKCDILPYYFNQKNYHMEDISESCEGDDQDKLDDMRAINFEEEVGAGSVGLFTLRKDPPLCLSGDVVAFKNPMQCNGNIKIARLVGMGGQRVSFICFPLFVSFTNQMTKFIHSLRFDQKTSTIK